MSNSANQLGGKCPYMPYLGRGQMSGGNMSYTHGFIIPVKIFGNVGTEQPLLVYLQMSRLMRKPTIYIGENKDADQLRGNCEADQRLCFRYSDSTIPLLLKSEISSF